MNEELKKFVAGFDLAGKRLPNGKLQSYFDNGVLLDDWPQEVKLFDNTYTLDYVNKGNDGYETGIYV